MLTKLIEKIIYETRIVKALQRQLESKALDIRRLENDIENYRAKLEAISETMETKPENCVPGSYCKSCDFVKEYYTRQQYMGGVYYQHTNYICGKGQSCPEFIQKKLENFENKRRKI